MPASTPELDLRAYEDRLIALELEHQATFDEIDDRCEAEDYAEADRLWRDIRPDDFLSHHEAESFARCLTLAEAQLLADHAPDIARSAIEAVNSVCEAPM